MKRKPGWKFTAVFMVIFLSAFFIPARALASESGWEADMIEMAGQGEVVSDVFVREGPSTEYGIIGTVRGGDVVSIMGKTKDYWYRIEFEGQPGFVYGDYIKLIEEEAGPAQPEEETKEPETEEEEPDEMLSGEEEPGPEQGDGQPEEGESQIDWGYLRLAAVVLIVAVIVAMTVLILRSLLQAGRQDREEEKKRSRGPKKEKKSRNVKREGKKLQENGGSVSAQDENSVEGIKPKEPGAEEAKTIVIREEDYQLHIDPKYFEDEPLAQPDYVTDYLKKKELEDTKTVVKKERTDDLTKAMKKLEELQEEIERLKNK